MEKTHPSYGDRATRLGEEPYFTCEHDQEMERLVTPRRWGTSPSVGPLPPCEQALNLPCFSSLDVTSTAGASVAPSRVLSRKHNYSRRQCFTLVPPMGEKISSHTHKTGSALYLLRVLLKFLTRTPVHFTWETPDLISAATSSSQLDVTQGTIPNIPHIF